MTVALVTCLELPEPDLDEAPLLAALAERGISAELAAWDDPSVDWGKYALAIVRSTWNYYEDIAAFTAWIKAVSKQTTLHNSADLLLANTSKEYLVEYANHGIHTVPTTIIKVGDDAAQVRKALANFVGQQVVAKPLVSAGSFATISSRADDPNLAEHVAKLLADDRDVLVQPYIKSVDERGERCLVVIAGQITHAVRKTPRFEGSDELITGTVPIDEADQAIARQVLNHARATDALYARVDLADDDMGRPMLMELELIEPSLFLIHSEAALNALVAAVDRELKTRI